LSRHLKELKNVAPNWGYERVRVLLSTRRQDTRLASGYAQSSNRVRGAGQQNFERWVHHLLKTTSGFYQGGGVKLDYSVWREEISQAIGEENVFFIPFELLQDDERQYLRRWLGFIGEEKVDSLLESVASAESRNSQSAPSESKWFVRDPIRTGPKLRLTRLFQTLGLPTSLPLRRPDFKRDDEIYLTNRLTEEILDVYEEGNQLLGELEPTLDLKKYGYY
jgi:hypothetical protein